MWDAADAQTLVAVTKAIGQAMGLLVGLHLVYKNGRKALCEDCTLELSIVKEALETKTAENVELLVENATLKERVANLDQRNPEYNRRSTDA